MVAGLLASLSVRRRRVWLRIRPIADDDEHNSIVQVGGLARSDSGNFTAEFAALAARLATALGPPASPPAAAATVLVGTISTSSRSVGADPTAGDEEC